MSVELSGTVQIQVYVDLETKKVEEVRVISDDPTVSGSDGSEEEQAAYEIAMTSDWPKMVVE